MQHVFILLAFLVTLLIGEADGLADPSWMTPVFLAGYLAVSAALTRVNTSRTLKAMAGGKEIPFSVIIRRRNLLKLLTQFWLVAGLAAVIFLGYGSWVTDWLGLRRVPLLGEVLNVAPFVAALGLCWVLDWPFQNEIRRRVAAKQERAEAQRPTLGQYLDYNLRHQLLFVAVPVGLIILAQDVLLLYVEPLLPEGIAFEASVGTALGVTAGAVFFFAPLMIVRIWRTCPLPDGHLRQQLERICRDMKLRCRDILIWHSGRRVANAGVMGLAKPVRYVLLSDLLLEQMDDEQIKAIFAHEAGHIVSHHILYMALFAVAAGAMAIALSNLAGRLLGLGSWSAELVALAVMGAAWAVGFGRLSRRLERQSDVIAAWACGPEPARTLDAITAEGAAIFASSLRRVAELNGISPAQRSWRHGSILSRINYIVMLAATGGDRTHIDRLVSKTKRLILLALTAGLAMLALQAPWLE